MWQVLLSFLDTKISETLNKIFELRAVRKLRNLRTTPYPLSSKRLIALLLVMSQTDPSQTVGSQRRVKKSFAGWDLKNSPLGLILFLASCRISQIIVFWLFLAMAFHLKLILPHELTKIWSIAKLIHFKSWKLGYDWLTISTWILASNWQKYKYCNSF